MRLIMCLLLVCGAAPAAGAESRPPPRRPAYSDTGVLILAHGGSAKWNNAVRQTVGAARLAHPTQIAFGMGMHGGEVEALQRAVDALSADGVRRIVAVPLLVSSHSEVMRQYEYLLGAREHGPWEHHAKPIHAAVPIDITRPLNDDPAVAEVLLDRAREVSRQPGQETVVLVAHGPNEEQDNARWLQSMQRVAGEVQGAGGFHAVIPVTMRDDAEPSIQEAATHHMRALVEESSGHALTEADIARYYTPAEDRHSNEN